MFQDVRDAVDWVHYKVFRACCFTLLSPACICALILTLQVGMYTESRMLLLKKNVERAWRDVSETKSTGCSCREP
jgi:hypothetical protein